jgi:hypothetical protein
MSTAKKAALFAIFVLTLGESITRGPTGVSVRRATGVPVLLGHSSIRITERHCAPWTRSRQKQIEAELKAAWSNDPVVLTDGKGTPEMQGKPGQIN